MIIRVNLQSAVNRLSRDIFRRLTLADAVLALWSFVMETKFLEGVFERHRGRSFEDVVRFPVFVELIADALLQYQGSGRQSFQRARETQTLPGCIEAVYGKLRRVPVSLSEGFLEDGTSRLRELRPTTQPAAELPASLKDFTCVIVDGKTLNSTRRPTCWRRTYNAGASSVSFNKSPKCFLCNA